MADLSAYTSMLLNWLLSPIIWFVLIIVFVVVVFGYLWIRKKRKLIYSCIEIVKYKGGKAGFNKIKAGWFGKKKFFRGLWDYGEEQVETQDGDKILNFSTEDFQEIDGKRGIVIARDPVNPDILVPITTVSFKGEEMLAEIAPAEYRDAVNEIIIDVDRETSDWTKQLIQWIIFGMIIVFALVSIIVITQMVKSGQDKASALIVQAGETCLRNAREICQDLVTTRAGASP